jgi:hypothetical protein
MKIRRKIIVITCICVALLSIIVLANSPVPGTEGDPVVTVSYVENKLNEIKGYLDQRLSSLNLDKNSDGNTGIPNHQGTAFKVIDLNKDEKLIGAEGTEIILRSGTALAIDNGVDGVSDLTLGKDLKGGEGIFKNHHLIVPRSDGRGILATSQIWVMVKGDYQIQ